MASEADEVYTYDSVIRGHHVYKLIWTPRMGKQLPLRCEDNVWDATAVAVMKGIVVVGHLLRVLETRQPSFRGSRKALNRLQIAKVH